MTPIVLVYNALLVILALAGLAVLARRPLRRPALPLGLLAGSLAAVAVFAALLAPVSGFGKISLLTWAVFLPGPVLLLAAARLARDRDRPLTTICVTLIVGLILIGLDAFLVEPRWLQITHISLPTDRLDKPVRVALVADLQTDAIGRYEERVFALLAAEEPDLILLAGDYLHIADPSAYRAASADLNALLRRALVAPPLGIYAVQGNVDWSD
jgi:hypothetical protein